MSTETETERRKQLFISWCLESLKAGVFKDDIKLIGEELPTESELAEARVAIEKERGPEMDAMVKLIEIAELGEREAAAKYFDECGSKLTAQVLRDGRHRLAALLQATQES